MPEVPAPTPDPNAELPEAVQAIRRIEQKSQPNGNGVKAPTTPGTIPNPVSKPGMLFNFIPWTGRLGLAFKILFGAFAAVLALFVIMTILMLTSIDTAIFKLSLNGLVTDPNKQPIANATIKIDGRETTTDSQGKFSIGGLEVSTYEVAVTANGFEPLEQEVGLGRSLMNYSNYREFTLTPSGIATLNGKLISPISGYDFTNDRIVIAETEYRINDNGAFSIPDLTTGNTKFEFRSVNFRDEVREFELDAGVQTLPDIVLSTAGDITASVKSWVREDLVLNLKVTVESVDTQYVEISEAGLLRVKDLEIGKTYKLRSEYPGYETRDYEIKVAQGENPLFDFRVVEKGFVPFQRKVGADFQIFIANFDGKNEKQLTADDTEPYGEFIEGKNVYFMSTRDNLFSDIGVRNMLAYVVSTEGGNPQRVTTTTTDLGRVVPNFKAAKMANVREGETSQSRVLEVLNLQGASRNLIEQIPNGQFNNIAISNDGSIIWYSMQNSSQSINGLYRAATSTTKGKGDFILNKDNIMMFSISESGDRVLYSATNEDTGLQDLYMYTYSTRQDRLVKASFTGNQYQFISGSEDKVGFIDNRDGAANLYLLDLGENTDARLTDFAGNVEGVEAIFQQAGYMTYRTNKGLYIIDVNQPHAGKLITNNVARYTGYDF
jgi:Tol biopolymer transport system component